MREALQKIVEHYSEDMEDGRIIVIKGEFKLTPNGVLITTGLIADQPVINPFGGIAPQNYQYQ